ncbi:hypothetical protein ACHWQZ_G005247 [Mnemiopsis leidyi]
MTCVNCCFAFIQIFNDSVGKGKIRSWLKGNLASTGQGSGDDSDEELITDEENSEEYMNNGKSKETLYFRGDLKVSVNNAVNLPNADGSNIKAKFDSLLSRNKDKKKDLSDPYVNITIDDHKILQTKVIKDELNPVWNETFETEVSHEGSRLYFWVWDDDVVGKEKLGHASIDLQEIINKKIIRRKLELFTPFKNCKPVLDVEIQFEPVSDSVGEFEITRSYFPLRHSGQITLYQDACCLPSPAHKDIRVHGSPFIARSAWSDISESISNAKRFIYITGWSMTHSIRLIRDPHDKDVTKSSPQLGDILKEKASQGVQVLVLLWDEPFNNEELAMSGVVGTNDEVTRIYFSNTKVKCVLAARQKNKRGMLETFVSNTSYSHHQKTVICDEENASCGTVAYLGGLDLTVGRYDDQNHSLFESISNQHADDFYQTFPGITGPEMGPRQPWHDVHSRITGEAALDVLSNFTERWKIEAPKDVKNLAALPEEDQTKSNWRIQIYRSIPVDAALFDDNKKHLLQAKHGRRYEATIHRAYVSGVRNAENFLYIENQYFLGSAHTWFEKGSPRCNHLVPVEIALQICEMIERGRRFTAYILIPLFPEGDPLAPHIQEILFWQTKTMTMMYKKIAKAIKKANIDAHPCDYLNFFCLGKRETPPAAMQLLTADTPANKMARTGRAMIYVHSKALVVDDIYAIVGSANINQRSMDGRRDTEIAVGCWETQEGTENLVAEGHVQGLRKSLWVEHLGVYEDVFEFPKSIECVRRVRELTDKNWELYLDNKNDTKAGHMMTYPIRVSRSGDITPATDNGFFPDTTAPILGTKSSYLPSRLTV